MRLRGAVPSSILLLLGGSGLVASLLVPVGPSKSQAAPKPPKVNFSREVLPILSDKCFLCHGPDSGSRQAGLRLDQADSAYARRPDGSFAIVPGNPAKSLLVGRIHSKSNPMPPASSGKTLTKGEIDTLTRWISEGAVYARHWSFNPLPKLVQVPKVSSHWPNNDIDRFIFAKMQSKGLTPTRAADRSRWLRRVTLDLTGLPPTEQEIEKFHQDKAPNAYESVVDRLLKSPHYGERMAIEWLDAARYSDSYGYQSDLLSPTWPYRDWVVRAFNRNLPYNQFLTEQLAGDLLKSPTTDQRLATAFNRLHRQSNEGGSIALEYQTEYASDRVETFGTAVMGLTVGCAKCHDHKYDPLKQREYYQLFAYFNNIDEYGLLLSSEIVPTPSLLLPNPDQEPTLAKLRKANQEAVEALAKVPAGPKSPATGLLCRAPLDSLEFANLVAGPVKVERIGDVKLVPGHQGQAVELDGDNGIVLRGLPARERWEPFSWSFWVNDPRQKKEVVLLHRTGGTDVGFCGFDLMLEDGYLAARVMRHWPGNAVAIRTIAQLPKSAWTHVGWTWDGTGQASGLKLYVSGKPAATTVVQDQLWKRINAYGDLGPSGGEWSFGQRFRCAGFKGGKLDDVVFAGRELGADEMRQVAAGADPTAGVDSAREAAKQKVREAQQNLANFEESIYEISVMQEARKTVPAYVLARGQYDAPRTEKNRVRPGTPAVLPPLPAGAPSNRLGLAQWVTSPDHPLTSRVAVNRIWQMIFGSGLVESSENFGTQGSQPTHPELLDYLARRFTNSGWDVKALVKSIVLSSTYRQDSIRNPKGQKVDPENHLYWRAPSHRLTAEMVRDTALAASGLLNDKIGGAPVNPYQPAGIWSENNTMSPGFVQSRGADLYRRSLYSTWKRTTPMPSMLMFDATSREACTVRRPVTSTPLQALVLLNDVQFVEAARALATFVLKADGTDESRLNIAFRRLTGRSANAREIKILAETVQAQRQVFREHPGDAEKLLKVGESPVPPGLDTNDLAAMTVTVQMILNSDAVIWKR